MDNLPLYSCTIRPVCFLFYVIDVGSQALREPQEGTGHGHIGMALPTMQGLNIISHPVTAPVSTQPSGLPHHTPGLTGQHVLTVTSFTKEQVSQIINTHTSIYLVDTC